MKKRILTILCVLFLFVAVALPAYAAGEAVRLVDMADLLNDGQEEVLSAKLDKISAGQDLDVVIVTVSDTGAKTATQYADDYYDENGYAPDGILLLISMNSREWSISTTGFGITAFTDAGLDYLENQFVSQLSEGDYSGAFHTFADECEDLVTQARNGRPYDYGNLPKAPFGVFRSLLVSVVIGLVAALVITGIMASKLKTVRPQNAAGDYMKPGSMRLTQSSDMFLYRQVSKRKRETPKSGGSSTHSSSSGRSHGGSRGRF